MPFETAKSESQADNKSAKPLESPACHRRCNGMRSKRLATGGGSGIKLLLKTTLGIGSYRFRPSFFWILKYHYVLKFAGLA